MGSSLAKNNCNCTVRTLLCSTLSIEYLYSSSHWLTVGLCCSNLWLLRIYKYQIKTETMTSSTQLTPLQSSGSVIKIDIDSVIQQLLAVKDTPGKQVHHFSCFIIAWWHGKSHICAYY